MFSALAGSVFVLGIGILMACAMDGLSFRSATATARSQAQGPPYRQTKLTNWTEAGRERLKGQRKQSRPSGRPFECF
jgi:hypothetical protein